MKTLPEFFRELEVCFAEVAMAKKALRIDDLRSNLHELDEQSALNNLWNNPEEAKFVMQKKSDLAEIINLFDSTENDIKEVMELFSLGALNTDSDIAEFEIQHANISKAVNELKVLAMFNGENDNESCFFSIQAGAGGTESNDWAEMLLRMYVKWLASRQFSVEIIDRVIGLEAGIKSVTLKVEGNRAYGWCKSEQGVHRLVRISPFDSNARRHTSFASVSVSPILNDDVVITIAEKDLKIDTYRASGAGGQHVNKTDSAVRITHIPTGTVAQSQNSRSQHQNKAEAMQLLRSRLYAAEAAKKEQELEKERGEKCAISWGNQIRSYVLQPYRLIKDSRTGHSEGNVESVLNGNLDEFVLRALAWENSSKN